MSDLKEEDLRRKLTDVYGSDVANTMLAVEKKRCGEDIDKIVEGLRDIFVLAGGEKYAEYVLELIGASRGGG